MSHWFRSSLGIKGILLPWAVCSTVAADLPQNVPWVRPELTSPHAGRQPSLRYFRHFKQKKHPEVINVPRSYGVLHESSTAQRGGSPWTQQQRGRELGSTAGLRFGIRPRGRGLWFRDCPALLLLLPACSSALSPLSRGRCSLPWHTPATRTRLQISAPHMPVV